MNVETILQHIERRGPNFPKEALREAAARGDEIVPALLAILERTLAAPHVTALASLRPPHAPPRALPRRAASQVEWIAHASAPMPP